MSETQSQIRLKNIASNLQMAEKNLCQLRECLQKATTECEAGVSGDSRHPWGQEATEDIERSLYELHVCTSRLEMAFNWPIMQSLLKKRA